MSITCHPLALFGGIQTSSGNRSCSVTCRPAAEAEPRCCWAVWIGWNYGGQCLVVWPLARQLGLSEGWLRLYRHFHFFPWKDRLHPDKFSRIFIFPLQLPRFVIRLMFNQSGVKCVGWANAWCALSSWHETIFMSWGEKRRDGGSENIHFKIYR